MLSDKISAALKNVSRVVDATPIENAPTLSKYTRPVEKEDNAVQEVEGEESHEQDE